MKKLNDFGERLEYLIVDVLKITKNEFCTKTGISAGNLTRMINADEQGKKVKPGQEKLEAVMNAYPRVNIEWLIGGKGNPVKESREPLFVSAPLQEPDLKLNQELEKVRIELREKDKLLEEKERTISILQEIMKSKGFQQIEHTLKKLPSDLAEAMLDSLLVSIPVRQ